MKTHDQRVIASLSSLLAIATGQPWPPRSGHLSEGANSCNQLNALPPLCTYRQTSNENILNGDLRHQGIGHGCPPFSSRSDATDHSNANSTSSKSFNVYATEVRERSSPKLTCNVFTRFHPERLRVYKTCPLLEYVPTEHYQYVLTMVCGYGE